MPQSNVSRTGNERHNAIAERRALTVLFIDLVGSTALGGRMDPEDFRDVMTLFHTTVRARVEHFQGHTAKYLGDGQLIYFGYPTAHEDDPKQAIRTGLAVVNAVKNLSSPAGPAGTLRCRVGIASGIVIVGDALNYDGSATAGAIGDALNLAARLQSAARQDAVLICDATRKRAGEMFHYRALRLDLKGRSSMELAWELLNEDEFESRRYISRQRRSSMVGRQEELAILDRSWDKCCRGEGSTILISGEPGMGKSHLVTVFEQSLPKADTRQIHFYCSSYYQDAPLSPFIQHLGRKANIRPDDTVETRCDKLSACLPETTTDGEIEAIANLFLSKIERLETGKRAVITEELQDVFINYITQASIDSPTLIVFEDLHWADPTTLKLLNLIIANVEPRHIFMILLARTGFSASWRRSLPSIALKALSDEQATSFILGLAGSAPLTNDMVQGIIDRAEGVPFYIEELTKAIVEKSIVHYPAGIDTSLHIPPSLQASIMVRLERLDTGKTLAQIGAVIGQDFTWGILSDLSELPPDQVTAALDQLVTAGLVSAHGEFPNTSYTFKHALIQDAAYGSLLRDRRQDLHKRLATILSQNSTHIGSLTPQLIARHFGEAQMHEEAARYYMEAALESTGRFALAERVSHLKNALTHLKTVPRIALSAPQELVVCVALGRALIDHEGSGSDSVKTVFEEARSLWVHTSDVASLIQIHDGLVNFHFTRSEPDEILRNATKLMQIGESHRIPQALLIANRSAGFANLLKGNFLQARKDLDTFLTLYDVERDGPRAGPTARDPKVSVCTLLGTCLTILGYPEAGAAVCREGVAHGEALDHPVSLILGLRRACVQCMVQNDPVTMLSLLERLSQLSSDYETYKGARDGAIFRCWAILSTQMDRRLLTELHRAIDDFYVTKHRALLPFFMLSTAEIQGNAGDTAGAAELLERAAALVRLTGERWCEPEIVRLQALFSASSPPEALRLLKHSLILAKDQGAKLWELRTATSLAKVFRELGLNQSADNVLRPIYDWFKEGLETQDIRKAQMLLDG